MIFDLDLGSWSNWLNFWYDVDLDFLNKSCNGHQAKKSKFCWVTVVQNWLPSSACTTTIVRLLRDGHDDRHLRFKCWRNVNAKEVFEVYKIFKKYGIYILYNNHPQYRLIIDYIRRTVYVSFLWKSFLTLLFLHTIH